MNYYGAKRVREAKPHPTEWIIVPTGDGGFKLVRLSHV